MIRLVTLTHAHVCELDPQDEQADLSLEQRMELALAQASYGPAWTALTETDQVIAIGGMCNSWPGRGICWSGLSKHAGPHMLGLTRVMRRMLELLPYRRLEMYVDPHSVTAQRWAEMLGFEKETPEPMRAFLPDGRAAYLYGRVKE